MADAQDKSLENTDLARQQKELELELREEKADTHRRMAWTSIVAMVIMTVLVICAAVFTWVSPEMLTALGTILAMAYIGFGSVVGAYMGFTSWMSK